MENENQAIVMNRFIARQPILDARKNLFAYELMFRSGTENYFCAARTEPESSSEMISNFLLFGVEELTGGRKAFMNFTRNLLVENYSTLMPSEQAVIEIPEDVRPDDQVVRACRFLKSLGYMLALNGLIYNDRISPLITIADIVKVDTQSTPPNTCRRLAHLLPPKGIKLLADKVETHDQFRASLAMGYSYFQGTFFYKPEIAAGRDIPTLRLNYLNLLQEINKADPDFAHIERAIMREPALCFKLFRYLNSAAFYFRSEVNSVKHALALLGLRELRKWISMVVLAGMAAGKSAALISTSVLRARFCEEIGRAGSIGARLDELYLLGLFSLLDGILDRPLGDLLGELAISEEIEAALLGKDCRLKPVYDLVVAYESGDWHRVSELAAALGLRDDAIADAYLAGVQWAHKVDSWDTMASRRADLIAPVS